MAFSCFTGCQENFSAQPCSRTGLLKYYERESAYRRFESPHVHRNSPEPLVHSTPDMTQKLYTLSTSKVIGEASRLRAAPN